MVCNVAFNLGVFVCHCFLPLFKTPNCVIEVVERDEACVDVWI